MIKRREVEWFELFEKHERSGLRRNKEEIKGSVPFISKMW